MSQRVEFLGIIKLPQVGRGLEAIYEQRLAAIHRVLKALENKQPRLPWICPRAEHFGAQRLTSVVAAWVARVCAVPSVPGEARGRVSDFTDARRHVLDRRVLRACDERDAPEVQAREGQVELLVPGLPVAVRHGVDGVLVHLGGVPQHRQSF